MIAMVVILANSDSNLSMNFDKILPHLSNVAGIAQIVMQGPKMMSLSLMIILPEPKPLNLCKSVDVWLLESGTASSCVGIT